MPDAIVSNINLVLRYLNSILITCIVQDLYVFLQHKFGWQTMSKKAGCVCVYIYAPEII